MAGGHGGKRDNAGRPKGSYGETGRAVQAAMLAAFEGIGGTKTFTAWAKDNQTEFYKLWARQLPLEAAMPQSGGKLTISWEAPTDT